MENTNRKVTLAITLAVIALILSLVALFGDGFGAKMLKADFGASDPCELDPPECPDGREPMCFWGSDVGWFCREPVDAN